MGFVAFIRKEFYMKVPAYESMEHNGLLHFLFNNSTSPRANELKPPKYGIFMEWHTSCETQQDKKDKTMVCRIN